MSRARVSGVLGRAAKAIRSSLTDHHTPRQVAASFSVGTFVTMLPTLGVGLTIFVVLAHLVDWINKVVLFASVLVFNPVVKWGVYASSITLGFLLLGPVDGYSLGSPPSLDQGSDIIVRLLVGNLILAVVATVLAYLIVYRLAVAYDRDGLPVLEETVETVIEELDELADEHGEGDPGRGSEPQDRTT